MSALANLLQLSTLDAAQALLGWQLAHRTPGEVLVGMITETEAYIPGDPANHASRGRTERNAMMFLAAGHAYIYRTYGLHLCLNVVTGSEGSGEAVLIRALQPLEGIEAMRVNRGLTDSANTRLLCGGPGRLCQALGITLEMNGCRFGSGPLELVPPAHQVAQTVLTTTRIGITQGSELHYRFLIDGSPFVSRSPRKS